MTAHLRSVILIDACLFCFSGSDKPPLCSAANDIAATTPGSEPTNSLRVHSAMSSSGQKYLIPIGCRNRLFTSRTLSSNFLTLHLQELESTVQNEVERQGFKP